MQWRIRQMNDDPWDNMSETFSDYFYRIGEDLRRQENLENARRQEQLRQQQPQVPQQSQQPQRPQQPQEDYQEMIEQPQPRIINLLDLYVFPYADDQV